MLGKTAGGLFWMSRHLERSENTSRLVEAGQWMALTRSTSGGGEWSSLIDTVGAREAFAARHQTADQASVVDFLLRDRSNPLSVLSMIEGARSNARLVRTALTREAWEALNEGWMTLKAVLERPVRQRELSDVLATIRHRAALIRGAMHGTMLRNDIYNFVRLGTFIERADNTARILDIKYHVLLPSALHVGSSLDNAQWETILRSLSADHVFRWLTGGEISPSGIANFLILDHQMPRSLAFCYGKILDNLSYLAQNYGARAPSNDLAGAICARLDSQTVDVIFESGLHEFLQQFIRDNNAAALQIETDFRFYE